MLLSTISTTRSGAEQLWKEQVVQIAGAFDHVYVQTSRN
jgi:hypothetical protein